MIAPHRPARLQVDWNAIAGNVRLLCAQYGPNVELMAPVKANGYGHGAVMAAKTALQNGAKRLAVAMVDEAVQLRDAGIEAPILILGASMGSAVEQAVLCGAAMSLQDEEQAREMRAAAQKTGREAIAHIQIDTGMSRLGARGDGQLQSILQAVGRDGLVRIEGVYTHCFDGCDRQRCDEQFKRFLHAVDLVRAAGHSPIAHCAATEASLLWPEMRCDCVRPGIAVYGGCQDMLPGLKWAMRLVAKPVRIAWIEPSETVGYGGMFRAQRKTRIMTVPVGYADGYPRCIGTKGFALVGGVRVPVVGRVCMDMLMLDVTDVPGVGMNSEIVLLGAQGNEAIWPDEMAGWANTISYEIITGFHDRIARGDFDDKGADTQGDPR